MSQKYKSAPIPIPENIKPISNSPLLSPQYSNYYLESPSYNASPLISSPIPMKNTCYSTNPKQPDFPKDNTPPNKEYLQTVYMNMLANMYLSKSID